MTLRGAMILNGAAVIPIVYSNVAWLHHTALIFGIGALCAALATGATYLTQWALYCTWVNALFTDCAKTVNTDPATDTVEHDAVQEFFSPAAHRCTLVGCIVSILLLCLSLLAFALGLWEAQQALQKQTPQPQKYSQQQAIQ